MHDQAACICMPVGNTEHIYTDIKLHRDPACQAGWSHAIARCRHHHAVAMISTPICRMRVSRWNNTRPCLEVS